VVVQQLQTFYPPQTQIVVAAPAPQRVVVERDFVPPPVVVTRVEEVRLHPHGGPPGQIKKELGLQTGAEVVHGVKPGRVKVKTVVAAPPSAPVAVVPQARPGKEHGRGHAKREEVRAQAPMISSTPAPPPPTPMAVPAAPPGQAKGHEGGPPAGGPPGQQKEKGKGGGKGHGKD